MRAPEVYRPVDEAARALARRLIAEARVAALGVVDDTGGPFVSRVGFGTDAAGGPLTLVSALAAHTQALEADPRASLLLGEAGGSGEALAQPRLTLVAVAEFVSREDPAHPALAERWLSLHPRAGLWLELPDFRFVRLRPRWGLLNGGFGRAYRLEPDEMA